MDNKYSTGSECFAKSKCSAKELFPAEKYYYISLSIAKSMLKKGIIDEELFAVIDAELLKKYPSISGKLLAGKPLT